MLGIFFIMAHISPFKGLRPKQELAKEVAALPYDVCNRTEAKEEAQHKYHFYHITRSEIDLPEEIDVHSEEVYEKAKQNLETFINDGILIQDEKPCYYLYELTMEGRIQNGLLCASSIDDYNNGVIKKHEFTRPQKEQDRINHIATTLAQTGIVFLAYKDVKEVNSLLQDWKKNNEPTYNLCANDQVHHRIWVINDQDKIDDITTLFAEQVNFTYIADGHHRAASAAKVAEKIGDKYPNANYMLTCIFPESEVKILDYNRVVKDLNGLTKDEFIARLSLKFEVNKKGTENYKPQSPFHFGMYLDGEWYELIAQEGSFDKNDPIDVLDVQILQNNVLSEILNINDPRTDDRVQFVGGIRGLKALGKLVDNGEFVAAFSCYPVSMEQLLKVADSGKVMPPKSTWFEPKTRDGLVTYLIEDKL